MADVPVFVMLEQHEGYPPWDEEELLARPVGDERFQLVVTPTFARGLSFMDVVHVTPFQERLYVDRVEEAGGHSTIRVVLFDRSAHDRLIRLCESRGCDAGHTEIEGLFAVDIPPEASLGRLREDLVHGAAEGLWDFDEGAISDNHRVA